MSKKIQLPSGRLAEHATAIGKNADALALKLKPNVDYSTGTAQELVYDCMELAHFLQAFPTAFTKDVQNLKNVEKAFVASEKHIAKLLQTGVDFSWKE
ncbi:hypothetical protein [Paenilisteria rocourtiae]|uniref:Type VII secretion effector (TIGR04197 family) n=1 Tax=Listeria rocourtiae TaxID=647910 RepID=A0A4R6ZQP8_9LIST|nr:hypothetical protein [Listeria rocourtiae]EUJ48453.1 hypothetical protein PROCOU_05913 [Listeria rocourtiae FSL F6-920]TDR54815.1 type VII secretion effector (TIGR04197 family) [Listeria rocourtiae]